MEEDNQEITEVVEEVVEAPVEAVEAAPVEAAPVEELPVEAIADPGFWWSLWEGYLFGLEYIWPFMMAIGGFIALRHLIFNSLRFNYRHYLEHGEFVVCWGDDGGNLQKKERREKIAKEIKCDDDFVSWFAALCMSMVCMALHAVIALLWPVTMIIVFPLMVVRGIGYRKRKKIAFSQKLKGEHSSQEQQT